MLKITPTKQLTGITIMGDHDDLMELVDSIYFIVGDNTDHETAYFGVKNRLLGMCYDIRHASMGNRNVVQVENGMDEDLMRFHEQITPTHNVYYSAEVLFPEAIFVAVSSPELFAPAAREYGERTKSRNEKPYTPPWSQYLRDKANLEVLCSGIWQALGTAIGESQTEKLIVSQQKSFSDHSGFLTAYIDKLNLDYLKTPVDKRQGKLISIAKRIIRLPEAYFTMKYDYMRSARNHGVTVYELANPDLEYPEEIRW